MPLAAAIVSRRAVLCLLTAASGALGVRAVAAEPPRLAVFDFEFIDSSLEPPRPDEMTRLAKLDVMLRERLAASSRYRLVDTAPVRARIAAGASLHGCNGCAVDYARDVGAELAMTGWVQKVSNLILNINVLIQRVDDGKTMLVASVDLRGNTDESWRRGLDRLLRDRILAEPGEDR